MELVFLKSLVIILCISAIIVFVLGRLKISSIVGFLISLFVRHSLHVAIFEGFLISLSSTAIVMKILMEKSEIYSPHGRMSVVMLIFQDLCIVPFMLLIPVLAGNGGSAGDVVITMLKAALVVGIVLFASIWAVPRILHEVVSTRSRELFFMTIILLCLGTALVTSMFGLSLALGAFLAGIVISESEYVAQAISDILPFKESFTGLFFISVGMLLNLSFLRSHIWTISGIVIVIIFIKIITAALS